MRFSHVPVRGNGLAIYVLLVPSPERAQHLTLVALLPVPLSQSAEKNSFLCAISDTRVQFTMASFNLYPSMYNAQALQTALGVSATCLQAL